MKSWVVRLLLLGAVALLVTEAQAGVWTANGFIYKPAVGARGDLQKDTFDSGLDQVDARLGKQVWVGDPNYGTTFQDAVTAIESSNVTLHVPAGTHSISADLSIPANITLKPVKGAVFSIANTKTLAINGPLEAGLYQIFSCTGTGKVVFGGPVREVYPQWWASTPTATAFQAAVTAGKVFVATGSYDINTEVSVPSNRTITFAPGVTINSNLATESAGDCPNAGVGVFAMRGTVGSAVALAANPAEGAVTLTLSSVTGLAAKDVILIYDNRTDGGVAYACEVNIIESVSSPNITLRYPINFAYLMANSASVKKITPVENVHFVGSPIIDLTGAASGDVSGMFGIYTRNCSVDGLRVQNHRGFGVMMIYDLGSVVKDIMVKNAVDMSAGHGYGVRFWASRMWESRGGYFESVRHAVDVVSGSDWLIDGIRATRCAVTPAGVGAIETHGLRTRRGIITNYNISRSDRGILIGNPTFDGDYDITIGPGWIDSCEIGIYVCENSARVTINNPTITNSIKMAIGGQTVFDLHVNGGKLRTNTGGTHALITFYAVNGGSINGTVISGSSVHGINLSDSTDIDIVNPRISGCAGRDIYGSGLLGTIRVLGGYINQAAAQNVVELIGGTKVIVDDLTIIGAAGVVQGIYIKDATEALTRRNTIKTVAEAIRIENSDKPKILHNVIDGVTNGIRLVATMTKAFLGFNHITNASARVSNSAGAALIDVFGIDSSATGDVTGTAKSRKLQIYDSDGNSLGYIQTYAGP